MRFRHFCAIDWSGARGSHHQGIAIGLCAAGETAPRLVRPAGDGPWSREGVLAWLQGGLPADTLVGMDLGIALPFADCGAYFPGLAASPPCARALWRLIDETCEAAGETDLAAGAFVDDPRFAPFFRRHGGREGSSFHAPGATHRRGRMRLTEEAQAAMGCRPTSNFNLVGASQVGRSSLTGMRLLHRLGGALPVWPIDALPATGSVLTEIYTTIAAIEAGRSVGRAKIRDAAALDEALAALGSAPGGLAGTLDDHSCDALVTAAWLRRAAGREALWHPPALTPTVARTEGWTFGAR